MSEIEQVGAASRPQPVGALGLELEAIDRQQRRFGRLSLLAIVVSFVHMAAALALFSGAAWYEISAALAMTALVDVATWALAGYFDYAARRRLARSVWIKATFGFALAISMFLNGAYLYANRPPSLPAWMSVGIAGAFAVFVPMLIGVASLIRGELEDDRLRLQQASLAPSVGAAEPAPSRSRTQASRTRTTETEGAAFANGVSRSRTLSSPAEPPAAFANAEPNGSRATTLSTSLPTAFANAHPGGSRTPALPAEEPEPFANAQHDASRMTPAPPVSPFANEQLGSSRATARPPEVTTPFANDAHRQQPLPVESSAISTTDVRAIVAALYTANVQGFANARALARLCGWSSSSSGPKALKRLLAAGLVRETSDGFELVAQEGVAEQDAESEPLAAVRA